MNIEWASNLIREKLSPKRYEHSLQVARAAKELAGVFGVDQQLAYFTGLVHDYAKGIAGFELLDIAEKNHLIEDEIERLAPDLLHASVGALLLEKEKGIVDSRVLNAVRFHTLGNPAMSSLDKIVFLADMIEPGRDFPGVERLRCVAFRDLDRGMVIALESTLRYCMDRGRLIHPRTVIVRNHLLNTINSGLEGD